MVMIYRLVHWVLSGLGVGLNFFLMVLALLKTPRRLELVKVGIVFETATNIMTSLMNAFVMPRILTDGANIILLPTGLCNHLRPFVCYAGYMFLTCLQEFQLIWLISSYVFRWLILHPETNINPDTKIVCLTAFALAILSFFHTATWISFFNEKENIITSVSLGMEESSDVILMGPHVRYSTLTVFILLANTAVFALLSIVWIRKAINKFSQSMGGFSREAKRLNETLLKVYTFQACLPVVTLLGVLIFALQYFELVQQDYLGLIISPILILSSILSPFVYIINISEYWNVFKMRNGRRQRSDRIVLEETVVVSTPRGRSRQRIVTCGTDQDVVV